MSDVDELFSEIDEEYELDPDDTDNSFRVRDALEPPRQHPISTLDLHALIHQGLIDLNPSYQRDVVWQESKQIGLIDSIFRNFYIPPVIFAVQKDEDGEEIRTCVDGKQRLTSISKFMDGLVLLAYDSSSFGLMLSPGQIPHRDPVTKKKYWFTRSDNHSKSRLELPEPYKKQFQRKQITCVEYVDLVPGTERDIFQRVQLGMSLTPAEKLQAISSPVVQWISNLQTMWVNSEGGMADTLEWNTSRGRDFQGVAQLCFCCWHLPDFIMPTMPKIEKWLVSSEKPSANFREQASSILQSFLHLAKKAQYQKAFTPRVTQIEFIFIGLLLAKMRDCSWEEKAKEVLALRKHTRAMHNSIRLHEPVMTTMWTFVKKVKVPKPDPFETWEGPGVDGPVISKGRLTRKRKRDEERDASRSTKSVPKARPKRGVDSTPRGAAVQFVS